MARLLNPVMWFRFARQHPASAWSLVTFLVLFGWMAAILYPTLLARYHFHRAEQAAEQYDFAQALSHLEMCRRLESPRLEVSMLAARVARRSGALSVALRHLREYEQLKGADAEALRLERLLLKCQSEAMSISTENYLLSQVRQGHKDSPLILEAVAQGCLEQNRLPTAERYLNDCLQMQPKNAQALLLLGRIKDKMNIPTKAVEFYRRIVDAYPGHREGRLHLAQSLLHAGMSGQAAEQFNLLARIQPNDPAVRLGLALCRAEDGEVLSAAQDLDALIAENPRDKIALIERSRLALAADRAAEAESWLRQALVLDPSDRRTNYLLYMALKQQGKEAEAEEQKRRSDRVLSDLKRLGSIQSEEMDQRPNDPALLCELGTLYLRNGEEKQGVYWLQRALEQAPDYSPARAALAHYHRSKGRLEE